jgi:hypothetical protein
MTMIIYSYKQGILAINEIAVLALLAAHKSAILRQLAVITILGNSVMRMQAPQQAVSTM